MIRNLHLNVTNILRSIMFVLAAASLISLPNSANASEARAPLGVSVTVVRPCSVHASPAGSHASVRLSCAAATRGSHVLVGNGASSGRLALPTGQVRVTNAAVPGADAGRLVTLNF